MIEINEINNNKDVEIICTPAVNKTLQEVMRKDAILTLRLVEIPEIQNTIKMVFVYGNELELHFSETVKVNGVQATDNDDLFIKLKAIFPV